MALREIKLCLLGDAGVGKSSLVMRFVSDIFTENSESTIGASFMSKTLVVDDKTYKYQIWDTAGQEKYRGLAPMYYRGAAVAILVYDITSRTSFDTLKDWVSELKMKAPSDIVLAVAGNKSDLDGQRAVATEEAREYSNSIDAIYFETSARTAHNVLLLFEDISRRLPQDTRMLTNRSANIDLSQMSDTGGKKKGAFAWCLV